MLQPTPASAKAAMLIRRPVDEVFQAFVDPAVTTKFWFTDSTGPLAEGQTVTWTWGMYGVSAEVKTLQLEPNKTILIDWGAPDQTELAEWTFAEIPGKGTYVSIQSSEYPGPPEEQLKQVEDNVGGFTLVLAGAKAWLEHNLQLNLVLDRFPAELQDQNP